ncbi:MAG: tRNA epoxyqueuosine(34) reductase QueG [Thermomicrobiales bacterium]
MTAPAHASAALTLQPPVSERQRLTTAVKRLARSHGLSVSAVTDATALHDVLPILRDRIDRGHLAGLDWFTHQRAAESCDPAVLLSAAQSILSVGIAYWGADEGKPDDGIPRGRISRYARGVDYHRLLPDRMRSLHADIERLVEHPVEARFLTDHARIVDRAVAARAGLGWYGKNACLIVPGHGSWVMLGELLLDLDLEPDHPINQTCGHCQICLDRCPTGAIVAPYTVHAPSCISFQTIEQRGAIPRDVRQAVGDWVFGCDVCQDVCPYTGAARPEPDPAFLPGRIEHAYPSLPFLLTMSEQTFRDVFRGTAITRAKREGLARNAAVALGNLGTDQGLPHLIRALLGHDRPLVRGHAAWALGQIGGGMARKALAVAWTRERNAGARSEIALALETDSGPSDASVTWI